MRKRSVEQEIRVSSKMAVAAEQILKAAIRRYNVPKYYYYDVQRRGDVVIMKFTDRCASLGIYDHYFVELADVLGFVCVEVDVDWDEGIIYKIKPYCEGRGHETSPPEEVRRDEIIPFANGLPINPLVGYPYEVLIQTTEETVLFWLPSFGIGKKDALFFLHDECMKKLRRYWG